MHQQKTHAECSYASGSCFWTSKDPSRWKGGANFYAYGENDPVNMIDVSGKNPAAIAIGIAIAFGMAADSGPGAENNSHTYLMLDALGGHLLGKAAGLLARAAIASIASQGVKACSEAAPPAIRAFSQAETRGLRELFGRNVPGAQDLLSRLARGEQVALPEGVTRETLEVYKEVARSSIEAGKDTIGVQQLRLEALDGLLSQ
jgi:hypothetical protein